MPVAGCLGLSFATPQRICTWLKDTFGVVTWEPLLRQCYLGYAASGDFSEVLLAGAWGKDLRSGAPGTASRARFATFGELLARPTPDAGFYLGVKAAFEGLLWRREALPTEGALCTVMREPAMRYLGAQLRREEGR